MLRPTKENRTAFKGPGRWEANIDHIGVPVKGVAREKRAAHAGCNSARQWQKPRAIQPYINGVVTKFGNENWVKSVFGTEVWEKLSTRAIAENPQWTAPASSCPTPL